MDEDRAYDLSLKYEELKKILPEFDADGNGSYKHGEIRAALNAMDITPEERAELWAMRTKKSKASFWELSAPKKSGESKTGGTKLTVKDLALPSPGKKTPMQLKPKLKDLALPAPGLKR